MWTEKEITVKKPIFVGEVVRDTLDLSNESFEIREVTGECKCLEAKMVNGILHWMYTAQPFPLHLEYKDSYKSFSNIILATTQGRKQVKINVTLKQDKNGITQEIQEPTK